MLVCMCGWVYVCIFSIETQIDGWILMKFGMEVDLESRKVLWGFNLLPPTPQVRGV